MNKFNFNPIEVGQLEVGWWKAHNEKNKELMAKLLIEQSMKIYGFDKDEAKSALKELVTAVNYHDIREWGKAIEATTQYYLKIKNKTNLDYDPKEIAKLEVGWWQLHDKLENNPNKTELAKMFSKLYSKMFNIDGKKLIKAGKLKADATNEHDLAEDPQTKFNEIDDHWDNAETLLIDFYTELKRNI